MKSRLELDQSSQCLPLQLHSMQKVSLVIKNNLKKYSLFEIWLDSINNLDITWLLKLIKRYPNRLIIVLRCKNNSLSNLSLDMRKNILSKLHRMPCLVDLDIDVSKSELTFVSREKLKLSILLSYHNYKSTPSWNALQKILKRMRHYPYKILKISTFCQSPDDSLRLLKLLLDQKKRSQSVVILGMGAYGTITRIWGALWGNQITFSPLSMKTRSAEGQLTINEFNRILSTLQA